MRKLSAEKQLELRNRARDELLRLESLDTDLPNRYKEKFGQCEIVYKVILAEHQQAKGKPTDRLKVDMTQAPYALKYAGYDFDKNLLTNLFGAKEDVGSRSAKKLRDALTHSMNEPALKELKDREVELFGYMDEFLDKIRTFDAVA